MAISDYIAKRVRQGYLTDKVVPKSTPVLAFGPFRSARVATLGINPSKNEFLDNSGLELVSQRRRFETLTSLGADDLGDLTDEQVDETHDRRVIFFRLGRLLPNQIAWPRFELKFGAEA